MQLTNIPEVKLGLIAVSRDCFPVALSEKRRAAVKAACSGGLYECPVTVENEQGMLKDVVVIVPTMDATGTHIDSFHAGDQMNLTFSGNVCHVFGQDGKNLEF